MKKDEIQRKLKKSLDGSFEPQDSRDGPSALLRLTRAEIRYLLMLVENDE